jgi:hypothetical protein
MKLKKNPENNHYYLHNNNDQPLICPHQDAGTEIRIEQPKLQGQQPKQFIDKRHMPCGSWCALFRLRNTQDKLHFVDQECGDSLKGTEVTVE